MAPYIGPHANRPAVAPPRSPWRGARSRPRAAPGEPIAAAAVVAAAAKRPRRHREPRQARRRDRRLREIDRGGQRAARLRPSAQLAQVQPLALERPAKLRALAVRQPLRREAEVQQVGQLCAAPRAQLCNVGRGGRRHGGHVQRPPCRRRERRRLVQPARTRARSGRGSWRCSGRPCREHGFGASARRLLVWPIGIRRAQDGRPGARIAGPRLERCDRAHGAARAGRREAGDAWRQRAATASVAHVLALQRARSTRVCKLGPRDAGCRARALRQVCAQVVSVRS